MSRVISDPAEIFGPGFPAAAREQILAEARKNLAVLVPALAEKSFAELPAEIQTKANRTAMALAANETVKLKTRPPEALADTIRILRAWILKIELVAGPTHGSTRILVSYRKAGA